MKTSTTTTIKQENEETASKDPDTQQDEPTVVDPVNEDIYKEEIKLFIATRHRLKTTCRSLFNVVLGQSSKLMRNKLEEFDTHKQMQADGDVAVLLRCIKQVSIDDLQKHFTITASPQMMIMPYTSLNLKIWLMYLIMQG